MAPVREKVRAMTVVMGERKRKGRERAVKRRSLAFSLFDFLAFRILGGQEGWLLGRGRMEARV